MLVFIENNVVPESRNSCSNNTFFYCYSAGEIGVFYVILRKITHVIMGQITLYIV